MQTLETSARARILILDGAMGTMIQQYPLTEPTSAAHASPPCPAN